MNQTTMPAATSATMNCTSNNRPKDAPAKAATPRIVSGCQATCAFSTDSFIRGPPRRVALASQANGSHKPLGATPKAVQAAGVRVAGGAGGVGGWLGGGVTMIGTG